MSYNVKMFLLLLKLASKLNKIAIATISRPHFLTNRSALSKCLVAVGNIEGVVGSKYQVPLPARGSEVQCRVSGKKWIEGSKIAGCQYILTGLMVTPSLIFKLLKRTYHIRLLVIWSFLCQEATKVQLLHILGCRRIIFHYSRPYSVILYNLSIKFHASPWDKNTPRGRKLDDRYQKNLI